MLFTRLPTYNAVAIGGVTGFASALAAGMAIQSGGGISGKLGMAAAAGATLLGGVTLGSLAASADPVASDSH